MIPVLQLPPKKVDSSVLEFCGRLSPGAKPVFVEVRAERISKLLDCHLNVDRKVERNGGRNVFGWQISEIPDVCLEAQFHSIWETPDKMLVDITPEEFKQNRILFVEDPHRSYNGTKVSLERHALGDLALVNRFCSLTDQSVQIFGDLLAAGFQRGDPVYRIRLGPLQQEIAAIRQKLKNDA